VSPKYESLKRISLEDHQVGQDKLKPLFLKNNERGHKSSQKIDSEDNENKRSNFLGFYEIVKQARAREKEKKMKKERYLSWQTKVYKNVAKHSEYLSQVISLIFFPLIFSDIE
jgi:hypothetical protein